LYFIENLEIYEIKKSVEIKMVKGKSFSIITTTLCLWLTKWNYLEHWRKPQSLKVILCSLDKRKPLIIHFLYP